MTDFYQDLVTEQSLILLKKLVNQFRFILIGGWAVYLYTGALKSKDIDLIVELDQLSRLKRGFTMFKNDRLRKYEIKKDGIDIDIYVPFYSDLGIKAEEIIKYQEKKGGFLLPQKEILLITKVRAYQQRKASVKGKKDKIDIISLLLLPDFNFKMFADLIIKYNLSSYRETTREILAETKEVPELNLNQHYFARIKKEIMEKLKKLRTI